MHIINQLIAAVCAFVVHSTLRTVLNPAGIHNAIS